MRSRRVGRDIMADFRNIVGGEIAEYTRLMAEPRKLAADRMVAEATDMGANAVIGVRFVTSTVMSGASELVGYGTARQSPSRTRSKEILPANGVNNMGFQAAGKQLAYMRDSRLKHSKPSQ